MAAGLLCECLVAAQDRSVRVEDGKADGRRFEGGVEQSTSAKFVGDIRKCDHESSGTVGVGDARKPDQDPQPVPATPPDYLAKDRKIEGVEEGDLLAIMSAGAYGAVMASTYNSRPLIPEVLVDGDKWHVIRGRKSIDELIALDSVPDWA